jgi:SAM-dependent methyltransferase
MKPTMAHVDPGEFTSLQKRYWSDVDEAHYRWQTSGPYIAATEMRLLSAVDLPPGQRFLEIGCGEGANLHHITARATAASIFAVDFSYAKVRFASKATKAKAASADATELPFRDRSFDAVLIRDLLHHVADRRAVLAEAVRVLRPGGRLTVIEPNGRNPIVAAMALAISAERGMLSSTLERVARELQDAGVVDLAMLRQQPLPVSRVVLHYRLGAPSLGANRVAAAALRALEHFAAVVLPRRTWAYFVLNGRIPPSASPSRIL